MIPRPLMLVLIVVFLASLSGAILAADWSNRWLFAASAFVFSLTCSIAGFVLNRPYWRSDTSPATRPHTITALIACTKISALVYAWGAAALLLVYSITGLRWQHGWQYGSAMAIIALCMAYYVKLLDQGHPDFAGERAVEKVILLAAGQGVVFSVGLLWLVASGKVLTPRSDWAANLIFVAGGLCIVCLCAILTKTFHEQTRTLKNPEAP
jgi:biotin transporter BioY